MAKLSIKAGTTSVLDEIYIQNSTSPSGAGLTGLSSASAGLTCYVGRADDGNAGGTAISLTSTGALGTWASGWFKEKDATNMPGVYEFGYTNASLSAGSRFATFVFKGATNMAELVFQVELTGWDNQDAVRGGMTALPNANASASGGLLTFGTSTGQINPSSGKVPATLAATDVIGNVPADLQTIKTQTVTCAAGITVSPFVGSTGAAVNGTNANTLSSHDPGTTISSLTQTQVTGGAYALNSSSFAFNAALDFTTTQKGLFVIASGTAAAGGAASITLQTGLGYDNACIGCLVELVSGTGAPATAIITAYNDASKVVQVDNPWIINPDNTTVYRIMYDHNGRTSSTGYYLADVTNWRGATVATTVNIGGFYYPQTVSPGTTQTLDALQTALSGDHGSGSWADVNAVQINGSAPAAAALAIAYAGILTGTAQSGGASSIRLATSAVADDDYYNNQAIFIVSGTGAGQTNAIVGYVGSTRNATVETAWTVEPDNTSVYLVLGRIG